VPFGDGIDRLEKRDLRFKRRGRLSIARHRRQPARRHLLRKPNGYRWYTITDPRYLEIVNLDGKDIVAMNLVVARIDHGTA